MPRTARKTLGGYAYHVLNRGVGRMQLFDDDGDYLAFEKVLVEGLAKYPGVRLCAFCVMPNHWHLVVWPKRGGAEKGAGTNFDPASHNEAFFW